MLIEYDCLFSNVSFCIFLKFAFFMYSSSTNLEQEVSATLQVADSVFILGEGKAEHFCNISNESIGYCEMTDVARHKGKVIVETIIEK